MMATTVLLMWLKLFYFGRIFFVTAAMIRMVIEITYDMRIFLVIFILTVAGFAHCFFLIARNYDKDDLFTGNTLWRAFIYSYRQILGDFDTEAYVDTDKYYLYFIWILSTLIALIIFLNLLIAIMGDTFDRVQETTENNMLKELANIMVENEMLVNRKRLFGKAKYIIVIQEEKADVSSVNWIGRLHSLKSFLDRNIRDQNNAIKDIRDIVAQKMKERVDKSVTELETSSTKKFQEVFDKADMIISMLA